jgi:hypothetical protein
MPTTRLLAALLWLMTAIGGLLLVAAIVAGLDPLGSAGDPAFVMVIVLISLDALAFASAGLLITFRRPGNRIGWILSGFGLLLVVTFCGWAYGGILTGRNGQDDWLAGLATWAGTVSYFPMFALITLIPLLFPDGQLPSPRWRIPVAVLIGAMLLPAMLLAILPGRNDERLATTPFGVAPAAVRDLIPVVSAIGTIAVSCALVLGIVAVIVRFRGARGETRQQLKWFLAGVVAIAAFLTASNFGDAEGQTLVDLLATASLALLPTTIGIAILRYRLWEIDRLISRTVGWAVVSAIVLGVFAVGLFVLQAALADVTQGETLAVAASTLLALALFQPVRRRIQSAVDRRFDRSRFDAERVVERFAGRLRDQFDVEVLVDGFVRVAGETVRPKSAAVWLWSGRNERQTLES